MRTRNLLAILSSIANLLVTQSAIAQNEEPTRVLEPVVVSSTPLGTSEFESFQPVSSVSSEQLLTNNRTSIGEVLSGQAGVTGSSFGPGSSRPVIRGLGGDRIRVLRNGVGTLDVSNTSPDHTVTTEPLLAERVEIVRGPAALLYGTTAVGGVVNVLDNRIPEELPASPVTGKAELRGGTVDDQKAGVLSTTGAAGPFALHVDGFYRQANDIRIPGFARTEAIREEGPPEGFPEPNNTLPFSGIETGGANLGGSYVFDRGFVGAAIGTLNNIYGVPNGEKNISINVDQLRGDVRGRIDNPFGGARSLDVKVGLNDYEHTEFEDGEAGTVFKNQGVDTRLELAHEPLIGSMKGIVGLQIQRNDFEAIGAEAFQPPTDTTIGSLFAFEELPLRNDVKLAFGGRLDSQSVEARGYRRPGTETTTDVTQNEFTTSGSIGTIWTPVKDYALSTTYSHTERAPVAQELFANGPHIATGAFEIGDPNLATEKSNAIDVAFRKRTGRVTGFVSVFYNRINDYIGLIPTGERSESDGHSDEEGHAEDEHNESGHDEAMHGDSESEKTFRPKGETDGLPIFAFRPQDAEFYGFESQVKLHLLTESDGTENQDRLDLILQPDYVWARDRNTSEAIVRVTPPRLLTAVEWKQQEWFGRFEAQHVFRQNRNAVFETETGSYTLWNASLRYTLRLYDAYPAQLFLNGENLADELARNHVSFIKDIAPLPGRNISAGLRFSF